jgi:DNA-binding beta-propeller fold protein YncE
LTGLTVGNASPPEPLKPKSDPQFVRSWGKKGTGEGEFHSPIGIAVSAADEIYVTEAHGNRVQKFSTDGKFLVSFTVDQPAGIAVGRDGNVYVAAMFAHEIHVFTGEGKPLRKWGKRGKGDGEFVEPGGIAIGPDGRVYVADQVNRRVQKFTAEGKFLTTWGEYGVKAGQFGGVDSPTPRVAGPNFLAVDRQGNISTTEGLIGRVQRFTPDGKYLAHWGDNGSDPGGFGGREKRKVPHPFPGPIGICYDSQGRVWVSATNNRVQLFTADGKFLIGFGEEGPGPGQFLIPHGLAIDSRGHLFVVDAGNHRIQEFTVAPK